MNRFFGPFSTWIVQNSLDNADACLALMQVCLPRLIDSTTGHYKSTTTSVHSTSVHSTSVHSTSVHSTSLWLAFLTSVQQGTYLCSASSIAMPIEYIPEAPKIRMPLYSGNPVCTPWFPH